MAVYTPGNRGTIRGSPNYNVKEACTRLYEAMKGLGTDEQAIIDVLSCHTSKERQRIKIKYAEQYGKDLYKELDSEVSFSFGKLVLALMVDMEEFLLECIHKTICSKSRGGKLFKRVSSFFKEGLGGSELILIGLLCARSNADIKAIKDAYEKKYNDKLEDKIAVDGNHIPHDVCSFLLDMISGERVEEDDVDMDLLAEDINELNDSKNENALHSILQERSFLHLRKLCDELMDVCGKTIDGIIDDLQAESVELRYAYKAFITLVRDGEASFYAERVKGAIEGAGTDDDSLIKVRMEVVVLRSEVDMLDIMVEYEKKYKVEMTKEVGDDTSGDYKTLLMRMLTKPPSMPEAPLEGAAEEESPHEVEKLEECSRDEVICKAAQPVGEVEENEEKPEEIEEKSMENEGDAAEDNEKPEQVSLEEKEITQAELVDGEEKTVNERVEETREMENDEDECTLTAEDEETEAAAVEERQDAKGEDDHVLQVDDQEITEENPVEVESEGKAVEQEEEQGNKSMQENGTGEAEADDIEVTGKLLEPGGLEVKLEQASVVEESGSPIMSREL